MYMTLMDDEFDEVSYIRYAPRPHWNEELGVCTRHYLPSVPCPACLAEDNQVFSLHQTPHRSIRLWIHRQVRTNNTLWALLQENCWWGGYDKQGRDFYSWEFDSLNEEALRQLLVMDGWKSDDYHYWR